MANDDNRHSADKTQDATVELVMLPELNTPDHSPYYDERVCIQNRVKAYFDEIFHLLPINTRKAYTSDLTLYFAFCQGQSPLFDPLTPDFEQQKHQIKGYMRHQMSTNRKRAVITRHFSSISKLLRIAEIRNPLMASENVRDFISKSLNQRDTLGALIKPAKQDQALALDDELLNHINQHFGSESLQDKRDLALLNFCFNTLLRGSEIAQIQVVDLDRRHEQVFVRATKTDQSGAGCYRHVSRETHAYIDSWLNEAGIIDGPVFRGLSPRGAKVQFKGIGYQSVYKIYKAVLERCDIDPTGYTAHSCRVGGVVTMRRAGCSDSEIKQSGGWQSDTYHRYTAQTEVQYSGAARLSSQRRLANENNDSDKP
jgi:integrase